MQLPGALLLSHVKSIELFLLKYLRKCLCLLGKGGGGEGYFTDTKIALISPNPFVPDEKECSKY